MTTSPDDSVRETSSGADFLRPVNPATAFRSFHEYTLADLDALRVILRGGSVIDWHRLNFRHDDDIIEFLASHEIDLEDPGDLDRMHDVMAEAIEYLRRKFEYPIPASIEMATPIELFRYAAGKGHKQVCACMILKVMHIIHHLQGRELSFMLPMSDQEVFRLVEEKVYRVVGGMLTSGLPIVEFLGGRKQRDSLYTKLLSKRETIAAQIYDKLRFRIVTRDKFDLLPVVNYLSRKLFPFNYAIPGESTNTIVDFDGLLSSDPHLASLAPMVQGLPGDRSKPMPDNAFSAKNYQVVHFVVDLPVRIPDRVLELAPAESAELGRVVFVLVEFQIVDQVTEQANEKGEASHARYKERQRMAVMERLRMGFREHAAVRAQMDDLTMEHLAPPRSLDLEDDE
ncbi:MAG: TIGR04552 family protein [Deltaproteobacteria bacterium]|nr:TIGR04552 family protein [Deltaproteobacteria bacterium]